MVSYDFWGRRVNVLNNADCRAQLCAQIFVKIAKAKLLVKNLLWVCAKWEDIAAHRVAVAHEVSS